LASSFFRFFFKAPATTEIYTLSLHDALPISWRGGAHDGACKKVGGGWWKVVEVGGGLDVCGATSTILHPPAPSSTNLLLPHHHALERHRPRHDEPQRQSGDEQIAPAAPHLDAQVRDARAGAHLPRQYVLEIWLRHR